MNVQYRGMARVWRKRDRNMTIEVMSFQCERRLTATWQWSLCRFNRQPALYRRLSHTKCCTSGLESSAPHRTGDKTTLLDSKCRPSRFSQDFFSIPPDSKTYYEFILGRSAAMARRMPMFRTILYQFAMLTLNSYEKVSNILLKFPPITATKTW